MKDPRPLARPCRAATIRLAVVVGAVCGLPFGAAARQARSAQAANLGTTGDLAPAARLAARDEPAHAVAIAALPGLAWPAVGREPQRRVVCDLAAHAQVTMGLPMQSDPVFGRPPEASRLALATLLRQVEALGKAAAAESAAVDGALASLLAGPDGPGLLREGLRVATPGWRSRLLRAGAPLARLHPRLCGFVHNEARATDPALAAAASAFLLRSDCDSPALFGADGLRHPDATVRATAIDEVADFLRRNSDIGLLQRLQSAYASERSAALRARTLRHLARLQAVGAADLLPAAERDRDPAVRAEALVLRAAVARDLAPQRLEQAWGSPTPLVRAAAVRALATIASRPNLRQLATARGDRGAFVDVVTGERSTVGALASALSASLAAP